MTKKDIEKLIIDYGNFRDKVKTFEELIPYENNLINKLNEAINYTRCCRTLLDKSLNTGRKSFINERNYFGSQR